MLLDRIDIDAHGPLHHVELGPFAEHLNVIFGPRGSGKTAISRFVRDSLVQRDYPQGMLSASTGRVVWADGNGLVHCRREQDGTVDGRRTVEFESRGDNHQFSSYGQSWFGNLQASTDSSRAIQTLQLPESIVDGVMTDTAATSVARVVSACVRGGLDSLETYQALPLHDESIYHSRDVYSAADPVVQGFDSRDYDRNRKLRQQLADVEAELASLQQSNDGQRENIGTYQAPDQHWNDCLSRLHDRARELRARQSELRRWVAEIDRDSNGVHSQAAQFDSAEYQESAAFTDQNLRRRLDDLDAQMIRWRRALSEVRGLRSTVSSADYRQAPPLPYSPVNEAALRRLRLDGFLHAVDHYPYDRSGDWNDFYPEAYRPLHQLDEIDYRIESATRQIDWLLKRYADAKSVQYSWFQPLPEAGNYYGASTLGDSLRHIREDLCHLRRHSLHGAPSGFQRPVGQLEELQRSEQWLVAAIGQLNRHRESLLQSAARSQDSQTDSWARKGCYDSHVLHRERRESVRELDRISVELDTCLREAAAVRQSMRSLPIINRHWYEDFSSDTINRRSYGDATSAIDQRVESLRRRRFEILEQLRMVQRPVVSRSPLADAASGWLVRLSGGRLRRVAWPYQSFRADHRSYHRASYQRTGVTIDGRDEHDCSAADRALTVIAVRMAAGDLLARTGRPVPLILETHSELFEVSDTVARGSAPLAYFDNGDLSRRNHPFASALRDYSRGGRQVVLFTSNQSLAAQLSRVGARSYQLHSQPIVHAHRPLWKSHYEAEQYVGPYPHTYGHRSADEVLDQDRRFYDVGAGPVRSRSEPGVVPPVDDVNRDFDMAWREAYGLYDEGGNRRSVADTSERTDWSRDGYDIRDGYYVANAFTTSQPGARRISIPSDRPNRMDSIPAVCIRPRKRLRNPRRHFS